MGEELASKLRSALLHNQVYLKPLPREIQYAEDPNDPTLSYLSSMLLDDDQEEDHILIDSHSYQLVFADLSAIVDDRAPIHGVEMSTTQYTQSIQEQPSKSNPTQENWFKAMLMQCAQSVAINKASEVYNIVREIKNVASPGGTSAERTALLVADALLARLTGFGPQIHTAMVKEVAEKKSVHVRLLNKMNFRATQKFANESIIELCTNPKYANRTIHIVDYGIAYGCQWPALIKRLAENVRDNPVKLKITGIDFPSWDLKLTGKNLVELALEHGILLEFEAFTSMAWETVRPRCVEGELVFVNCNLRLRHLKEDGSVTLDSRKKFFEQVHRLNPELFFTCVLNANHNMSSPFFIQRFEEALNNYFTRMEFFEAFLEPELFDFINIVLGKSIMNAVACEGADRLERPCSYKHWDSRARRAGFVQVPVSSTTVQRVLEAWSGYKCNDKFGVGWDENWMLLGWKDVIIFGMCAWKPRSLKR